MAQLRRLGRLADRLCWPRPPLRRRSQLRRGVQSVTVVTATDTLHNQHGPGSTGAQSAWKPRRALPAMRSPAGTARRVGATAGPSGSRLPKPRAPRGFQFSDANFF